MAWSADPVEEITGDSWPPDVGRVAMQIPVGMGRVVVPRAGPTLTDEIGRCENPRDHLVH
jgi:hypothetical protein